MHLQVKVGHYCYGFIKKKKNSSSYPTAKYININVYLRVSFFLVFFLLLFLNLSPTESIYVKLLLGSSLYFLYT